MVASASLKDGGGVPVARFGGTAGHAATILEMLARMEAPRSPGDFTRLLREAGMEIPMRTHIEVITPLLTEAQHAFLREEKQRGCAVELFLLGGDERGQRDSLGRDFPISMVTDYGAELLLP